jgi:serine/threonine-protein kinase
MATVMLAEDRLLDRPVALKRLAVLADPNDISRLRREALMGASVSHQNLVSVYDVITTAEGEVVIVMEYVRGETLNDALRRTEGLPVPEALRILEGTAAGLDAIHRQGIVHRDVKPANILLGDDGAVKLADLGIASAPDRTRITSAGAVLGTFSYMAPEQLEGAESTLAIDIYALAAVAFEMLAGRKARTEPNPMAVAHAIATQPPPDLRDAGAQVPDAAAELVMRGMARDPAVRPGSAREFVSRLRTALEPQTTTAPIAAEPEPTRPVAIHRVERHRARRWVVPAALLALVAAVVAIALASTGSSPSARHAGASSTRSGHSGTTTGTHARTSSGATGSTTATQPATPSPGSSETSPASSTQAPPTPSTPGTSTPATAGPTPAAGDPVSAVKSFYTLAASHRFSDAWALADPAFRAQLGGYSSFQSGQEGDRSITFESAQTTTQSPTSATVAVKTTSQRTDGTQHCTGTVEVAHDARSWLLHQIHINCV